MSATQSRSRFPWHTVAIAALTIGLLWWFFNSLDVGNVWRAIKGADVGLIALAVLVTLQTYILRVWRWQILLEPVGRARFGPAFRTTVIGFTATFLLPGRIGEVLRPYLLARQEGFSAAATFATVIVERIFDMATVLLLFAFFLLTTSRDVGPDVKMGGAIAAALSIGALVIMAISAGHPERLGRWAGRATRMLPGRAAAVAARFVHTFVEGLAVMRRPRTLAIALALSIPLWLSLSLAAWLTSIAVDVRFPFTGSFFVMMYLAVGIALPTPAGVGGFQVMYQLAVVSFFQADRDRAGAAALVLHAVSIVPVSLLGLAIMAREGLSLGRLRQMSTAEGEEEVGSEKPEVGSEQREVGSEKPEVGR